MLWAIANSGIKRLHEFLPSEFFRTDTTGNTTYVNPKYCQISGLSPVEAFGDGWLRAVHPEDREKLNTNWIASTQKHIASSAEYRFVRPDGSIAWVFGQAAQEKNDQRKNSWVCWHDRRHRLNANGLKSHCVKAGQS